MGTLGTGVPPAPSSQNNPAFYPRLSALICLWAVAQTWLWPGFSSSPPAPGLPLVAGGAIILPVSTVQEIEKAIGQLPWPERLRVYRDLPDLIGRKPEDLEWQRAGLETFFADDPADDSVYDNL